MGDVQIRLQNMNSGSSIDDSSKDQSSTDQSPLMPSDRDIESGAETIPVPEGVASPESAPESDDVPVPENVPESESAPESDDTLTAAMEAILFAMGEAVPIDSLAQALHITKDKAMEIADRLSDRCRLKSSGVSLNWYEESIQLSTKPELYEYLIRIAAEPKKPKLTPTLLETLSIIAFRQPVTRMEVENIRGVNSDFAINRLVSFDLVEEVGRKEVPGRPLLFGTTQQFLRSFGIRSVDELPEPDSSHMEAFREEAEEEISSKLDI